MDAWVEEKKQERKKKIEMILESEMYGWKKKGKNYKKGEILCHNIFTTFSQKKKTLNGRLLLAVINGKKKLI